MKRFLALLLLTAACTGPQEAEPQFPYAEVFEQKLGSAKVYGIRIYDYAMQPEQRIYAVQLDLVEKVWTDTLYSEVPANDTVVNEVIFSEAIVQTNKKASYRLKLLDAE